MNRILALSLLVLVSASLPSCGPAKQDKYEKVESDESAFVVNMETENQAKVNSIEALNAAKLTSKLIPIAQKTRTLGRMPWDYEWIPTTRVLKVKRAPVTREWTDDTQTGTNAKKEAFVVQTKDSIGLTVGATTTCSITEIDAATYLYYFGEKPLQQVVDENVRGYAQEILAREFGCVPLQNTPIRGRKVDDPQVQQGIKEGRYATVLLFDENGKENGQQIVELGAMEAKVAIFKKAAEAVRLEFKTKGISVDVFGMLDLTPKGDIQTAINERFIAQQKILTAGEEQRAQAIENQTHIQRAEAEATAALKYREAAEAIELKNKLDIAAKQADALLEAAKKWNGQLPSGILPQGSNLLFGLDQPIKSTSPTK